MKTRLVAIVRSWREDWRATRESTKVIVVILAAIILGWAAFAIWFSTYEF